MSFKFKLVWGLSIILTSVCCGVPVITVTLNSILHSYIIDSLSPPDYPGSQFVKKDERSGSGGYWVTNTYSTPDTPDEVLTFIEAKLTGFTKREPDTFLKEIGPVYSTQNCAYESSLGMYLYSRGGYPCIYVTIRPDGENPSETLIIVSESYPEP